MAGVFALAPSVLTSGAVVVTAPAEGAAISGTYTFGVDVTTLPTVASVEYSIGSRVLGVATAAPYGLSYQTAKLLDGTQVLKVVVRDAYGNALSSAQRTFRVSNRGLSMSVTSPDLNQPLSGMVTLSLSTTDPTYYPTFWFANLDGEQVGYADTTVTAPLHTVNNSVVIDTTRFPNGTHELHIDMHSWELTGSQTINRDWRAMLSRTVTINNGHVPMDIAANLLHVYLLPGEQTTLTCKLLYTDDQSAPCTSPTFSSTNSSVATVSTAGVLSGVAVGFTPITVSAHGKQTKVYVWVVNNKSIPHFSGNGQLLSQYTNGQSLFVVAPFELDPTELRDTVPGLLSEVKRAGINTLSMGFYPNARSLTRTWDDWRNGFDVSYPPRYQYAAANGLRILANGDDMARGIGAEAWWVLNWPSGMQAVQYAMQKFAESGVGVAVDVVDEVSMIWGVEPTPPGKIGTANSFTSVTCSGNVCTMQWPNHPVLANRIPYGTQFVLRGSTQPGLNTPPGQMFTATASTTNSFQFTPASSVSGTFTTSNDPNLEFVWWGGEHYGCPVPCNPPVPNNAISTFSNWMKTAPARVPISWPAMGVHGPTVHGSWYGKSAVNKGISDYASHYWDTLKGSKTYPWGWGSQEATSWMRYFYYDRQNFMDLSRPQLLLSSLMGAQYRKNTAGSNFDPTQDSLMAPGATPRAIGSTMMTAAAMGAAGLRLYAYDASWSETRRANAALGSIQQTGADPFQTNVEHWYSMGYASNLLTKVLEPYVLSTALNSPAYGRDIITAARQGSNAKMLMIVNGNDFSRTLTVDFSPYRVVSNTTRYILSENSLEVALLPDTADTITLDAGQTVVYLFPATSGVTFAEQITFTPPVTTYANAVLRYNYIYDQHLPNRTAGVDCQPSCTLTLDRRLGDVHYQYTYLDATDRVVAKSSVLKIAPTDSITVDTTAPSTPTGLTAAVVSSSQINLTWTASTDNVAVAGYKIFRNGLQLGTIAGTSYSSTGLSASTSYSYTVSAYDAAGNNSGVSTPASATTLAGSDTTAPSTPTGLTAATVSSSQINLSWTASTDNVAVTGYKIFRNGTQIGTSTTPSYSSTGLSASTSYSYTVSAYDGAGNNSGVSAPASATTSSASGADTIAPSTPGNVTPTPVSSTQITVTWSASTDNVGVTGYRLFRNGVVLVQTTSLTYPDANLSPSTTYTYTVQAFDAAGNTSPLSSPVSAATLASGGGGGGGDTIAPTVVFTSPANGDTVTGDVVISVNATDNVGVVGVQFSVDRASIGAEDITPPYSIVWNSASKSAGNHSIAAVARDAAGNSTKVSINVRVKK